MSDRIRYSDADRFTAMLHYIIEKCGDKPNVGKTVLYKLCYFCDFDFYELYERKLTGAQYVHLDHGPAPSSFLAAISNLTSQKKISGTHEVYRGKEQDKFHSLTSADMSMFTPEEMEVIDAVISKYSDKTATEISAISHRDTPWQITDLGEPLDYEAVFYRSEEMSVRTYDDE